MADGERLKPIEGVVLPPLADVVYQGSPFAAASRVQRVGCGTSILDMVDAQNVPRCFHPDIQVFVGDHEIEREKWALVKPKPGAEVFIRVNLRGGNGGGKDVLRAVAMIAVMVVAYYVAGPFAAGFFQAGSMAATVASAVVATAVATAGMALVNALIPPPSAKNQWGFDQELGNPYGQITGLRNQAAPYGPIPRVFGKRRMFPMLAGRPYTETIGNDQYLRLLLLVGFGPLKLSDIRLGETPISSIQGLEIETREGWENDAPVSLYTKAIQEDSYSIVLDAAGTGGIRTTRPNTKEISVEVAFPSGVNRVKDNELRYHEVSISVQYRATGSNGAWINAPWTERVESYGTKNAGELFTRDRTQNGLRRSGRWSVPVGQYDVKVIRNSPKEPMGETGYALWTTLRSIVDTDFLPMKGLSLIAMRIKASGQLNGVPDQINCVAESYLPVYNGSAWNWEISRSPAWAYAHILRYRGLDRVHEDNRLHLPEIKSWADACAAAPPNGDGPYWTFDAVIEGGSIFSNLRTVASHGRAAFHIKDGKYSVVRDVPQSVPVQSFSPRNSWGYAGSKVFSDLPHALRVRFPNEEKQFAEDEVIVYAPGYSKEGGNGTQAASTYETLDMPACCRPSQAWREGMYHYAVLLLRPETHTIYADVENLRCQMGSFVRFSHDVIKIGLGWGRVSGVVINGANVTHLTLDGRVDMAPGTSYGIRCRKDDFASVVMPLAAVSAGVSTNTVQLATPIPLANAPAAGDLYQFGVSGLESAPMMVKRIAPSDNLTAQITLVDAQPGVWTADSGVIPPFETYITNPVPVDRQQPPMPVMRLTSDSSTAKYANDGTVIERVLVSFDALPSTEVIIDHLNIQYREIDTADFTPLPPQPRETASVFIDKVQAEAGYEVRAQTVTATGMASDWNTQQITAKGKTTPPLPPTTLAATAGVGSQVGQISLAWTLSTDADLWGTEIWCSADNNRANAQMVGRVADPGQTFDHALAGVVSRYYWVRSQDLSGNYSTDNPNAADKWFPASATAGVLGQTRSILITDLDPSVSGPVLQIDDILIDVDEIRGTAGTALQEASEAKSLAVSTGYPSLNLNPVFGQDWTSGQIPPGWTDWGYGWDNTKVAGIESANGIRYVVPASRTTGTGLYQPSGVGDLGTLREGEWVVMELTIKLESGSLSGTGFHLQFYGTGGIVGSDNIQCSFEPDISGVAPGAGVPGRTYRWSKLVKLKSDPPGQNINTLVPYLMAYWDGYDPTPSAKAVVFTKHLVRAADAAEVESGKARASYPTLEARLTDQNTSLVTATAALSTRQSLTEAKAATFPNLIKNSDFSQGLKYWTSTGYGALWHMIDDPSLGTIAAALGGVNGQNYFLISDDIRVNPNTTYTLGFNGDGGGPAFKNYPVVYMTELSQPGVAVADGTGGVVFGDVGWGKDRKSTTFTTTANTNWIRVVVAKSGFGGGAPYNAFISKLMLNYGSVALDWTDEATSKSISGRVETSEGVIASISGKVQAWWQKVIQAGDGMAFIQATATDNNGNPTSEVAFGARKIGLYTQNGNGWIEVLKLIGTAAHFAGKVFIGALQQITLDPDIPAIVFTPPGGSVKMLFGAGFGVNSDCIMWLGPKTTDVSQISRSNGNWAFGTDGAVYYGSNELTTGGGGGGGGAAFDRAAITGQFTGTQWSTIASLNFPNRPSAGFWEAYMGVGSGTANGFQSPTCEMRIIENGASTPLATSGQFTIQAGGQISPIEGDTNFYPSAPWSQTRPAGNITLLLQIRMVMNTGEFASINGDFYASYTPKPS